MSLKLKVLDNNKQMPLLVTLINGWMVVNIYWYQMKIKNNIFIDKFRKDKMEEKDKLID